jgi:galactokinase
VTETRAFAPGRVNLIGEHTDYNDGLCLPFAIEKGITVGVEGREGGVLNVLARDLAEEDRFAAADPPPAEGWRAYVRGIVAELGIRAGARIEIAGDLPIGAGLGSSAALCLALALALLELEGRQLEPIELARACARVEEGWAGAKTGLLDQLASLKGRQGQAVLLDLRGPRIERVPLAPDGFSLALLDSGAPRSHTSSGYNRRREECQAACRALGIASLRDAAPEDAARLEPPLDRRLRHVLDENERVRHAAEQLRDGHPDALGPLINASHASLRDLYEVSVPEVERTVEAARAAGATGARLMGGGFGGSVLALFPPGAPPPEGALTVLPAAGARVLTG